MAPLEGFKPPTAPSVAERSVQTELKGPVIFGGPDET